MRDVLALSIGSILSLLLAVAPLATSVPKSGSEPPLSAVHNAYPQCLPYIVSEIAPKSTLFHHCGESLLGFHPNI